MGSEYLPLNYSCEGEIVEQLSQHFPNIIVLILPHAFIIKPIVLSDASWLMISSKNCQPFFVPDFQAQKKAYSFDGVVSSVDIISQKKIVSIRDIASDLEQLHKVVELPMYISADVYRCSHVYYIGFFREDLPESQPSYLALSQRTLISC